MVPEMSRFQQWWGQAWADLLASQQAFLSSQFGVAMKLLEAGDAASPLAGAAPAAARTVETPRQRPVGDPNRPSGPDQVRPQAETDPTVELVARAQARMREGFPPPREIYQIQNRQKIDWTVFPDWARPVSPELYDGCSHEG